MSDPRRSSEPPLGWRLERSVPLAFLMAFVVQTAGAVAWAGGAAERIAALERRLDRQSGVNERLARLEAESEFSRAALLRIEAKLDAPRGGSR